MLRQAIVGLITVFLGAPFLEAQAKPVKLPSPPPDARRECSRFGEVQGQDAFAQTLLVKLSDGRVETVPFSRWTGFFKPSSDTSGERLLEIEPTDLRMHDRVCVVLDPSEATANSVLVLEPMKTHRKAPEPPEPSSHIAPSKDPRA